MVGFLRLLLDEFYLVLSRRRAVWVVYELFRVEPVVRAGCVSAVELEVDSAGRSCEDVDDDESWGGWPPAFHHFQCACASVSSIRPGSRCSSRNADGGGLGDDNRRWWW